MRNREHTGMAFGLSPAGGEIQRGGAGSPSRAAKAHDIRHSREGRPLHNHRHSREGGNPEKSPKLDEVLSTTPSQRENGYAKTSEGGNPYRTPSVNMAPSHPIGAMAIATLALLLLACTQTPADVNNAGHEPFEQAELETTPDDEAIEAYGEALSAYEDAQLRVPEKGEPYYNAGNALYRMQDYEAALSEYDEALIWAEDDLRAKGFFNKGNVYFDMEDYPQAIEEYKKVLRIDPENDDAKHNLELAMSMLPQQDEQEQGEEPEENDQQGPEQQEQEQQDQQQDQQQEGPENEEEQQEEQQDEEQEGEEGDQEEEEQPQQQPQASPQTEPITEEQARQLLQSVADDAETLQERLQQVLIDERPAVNPW